jgi:AraC-like DNA-binding protein
MTYAEVKPHPALEPYIDVYWTVESDGVVVQKTKILPDGCIDIIINLEGDYKTTAGVVLMKSETAYVVGTMTRFIENIIQSKTRLLGIRFKPAAFSAFYKFSSLHEFTDQHIEFEKGLSPDIHQTIKHSTAYLNQFFINKLSKPKYSLMPVIASIHTCRGQVNVRDLAQQHFTTPKQLERHFKYHIGTSPKEFINLIRYRSTYDKIKNNTSNKSLLQIAYEAGYYDHAHLTKEIKKYTGTAPSQI